MYTIVSRGPQMIYIFEDLQTARKLLIDLNHDDNDSKAYGVHVIRVICDANDRLRRLCQLVSLNGTKSHSRK